MSELVSAVVRTWWRYFVTGHPVRGERRDNATFLFAASQDMRGKPYEKLSGPIWQRLARRWAVLGVPLLFLALSAIASAVQLLPSPDPAWTRVDWFGMAFRWWIIGAAVLAGYGIYRAVQSIRTREVRREFVGPAWEAACDAMGYRFRMSDAPRMVELPDDFEPPDTDPATRGRVSAWVHDRLERRRIAREIEAAQDEELSEEDDEDTAEPSTDLVPVEDAELEPYKPPPWQRILPPRRPVAEDVLDDPVRITLIPGKCSTTTEKNRFTQKVGPVLGMPDPKASWVMRGRSPYVELRPNRPPPPELTWTEILPYLDKPGVDLEHPLIGLSYGKHAEVIDFVNDSPHVLISAASGTGKTNLVKFILSQRMHLGAALVVLDFKLVSHRWAQNLPGCDYAWEVEQIHNLLVAIGEEIQRRKENAIPAGADVDTPLNVFPTLDILVEEQNALSDQLRDYWSPPVRQPGQPVQSPALSALRNAIYTGREFGVHVFSVAQRASASTFGANGGDARESFTTRIMADWTIQAWKMLAGGTPFVRCPQGGRGIFARVQNGDVAIVRVPRITDREARDWAMSGIPSPGQALGGEVVIEGETVPDTEPGEVTLSQARLLLPGPRMTEGALRKAAQRSGFPSRVGDGKHGAGVYELEALRRWRRARVDSDIVGTLEGQFVGPGLIYQIDVFIEGVGRRLGYIGKTRRMLDFREEEHRGDKPWSDLIIGAPVAVWESDACTDEELSEMEEHHIRTLFPLYNIEFQMGAEHAVPKWTQIEERHARDALAGRPPWVPRDVYNERKLLMS